MRKVFFKLILLFIFIPSFFFGGQEGRKERNTLTMEDQNKKLETTTLGAGCFWCVEAIFQGLKGVKSVVSGYSGGSVPNPTYNDVCSGNTGYAEVCQIKFDPDKISFGEILDVFWEVHDPTTLNRQGADVGTQYRSAIFYHNEKQKEIAERSKKKIETSGIFSNPVITEISAYQNFYQAEDYHQNYFDNNPNQPYCRIVISPKLKKFREKYKGSLK